MHILILQLHVITFLSDFTDFFSIFQFFCSNLEFDFNTKRLTEEYFAGKKDAFQANSIFF